MLYCSISLNLKIIKEILKYVFMYYLLEAKESDYAFSIIARHTCTEYMFMESIHSSHSYPVQTTTVCSYALCGRLRWQATSVNPPKRPCSTCRTQHLLLLHPSTTLLCMFTLAVKLYVCSWLWATHAGESLMDRNVLASHRLDRFFACKIATEFVTR